MDEASQGLRELSDRDMTLKLKDGRLLGLRSYGEKDGPPVFYFHGFPGSRLEAGFAPVHGIHLIALDRPGYGLSTAKPRRHLADWPTDVVEAAEALGFDRFGILGISGGAPYALACAWALKDRVNVTVLASGLGPPDAPGMDEERVPLLLWFGRHLYLLNPLAWLARSFLMSSRVDRRLAEMRGRADLFNAGDVARERAALNTAVVHHLISSMREGLRHSPAGLVSDARVYGEPWPFALSEIHVPVHLWHGQKDHMVPVPIAEHYASHLPEVSAHLIPEEGHFSAILDSLDDIVRTLKDAGTS